MHLDAVDTGEAGFRQFWRQVAAALFHARPQHVAAGGNAGARQHAADPRGAIHDLPGLVLADTRGQEQSVGMNQQTSAVPAAQFDFAHHRFFAVLSLQQRLILRQSQPFLGQQDDVDRLARQRFHAGCDRSLIIEDRALFRRQARGGRVDAARGARRRHLENFQHSFWRRRDLVRAAAYTTRARLASEGLLRILAFIAACFVPIGGAQADPFELGLPIACKPGRDCWISKYFDRAPAGLKDAGCGGLTTRNHDGTDFAVRDVAAMQAGVAVLASARGRVKAVRDGMADVRPKVGGKDAIAGKECGNGLVIEHGDGWETQYCHLRKDSITVVPGQTVAAGDRLGLVGLSGDADIPHVHLTVRKNGVAVDPYDGHRADGTCRTGGTPLWRADIRQSLAYNPVVLFDVGLTGRGPDVGGALEGERPSPAAQADPSLLLWVRAFGIKAGDEMTFRMWEPAGKLIMDTKRQIKNDDLIWFQYVGMQRPADKLWPKGKYRGEVVLTRQGQPPLTRKLGILSEMR